MCQARAQGFLEGGSKFGLLGYLLGGGGGLRACPREFLAANWCNMVDYERCCLGKFSV